jgi:GDP-L-fucose synthase
MTANFSLRNKKIWVAGHNGLVGGAVVRRLQRQDCEIVIVDKAALDLRRQAEVEAWIDMSRPDAIVLAAARVGGIKANSDFPADFIYDNLAIETNIIHAAHKAGVKKLLFLGSSCIYPKDAAQPISEDALLSAPLEPTNEWYAVAKIAGVKLCQAYRRQHGCDFIAAMPCNLYGPGDTYDALRSHVIPALIMKMHTAKESGAQSVEFWGTGTPLREFLYVDDLADALVFLLENYSAEEPVNVGGGTDISIAALAAEIAAVTGYAGDISFNPAYPDGVMRKLLDSSRLRAMGWKPRTALLDGLAAACADYRERIARAAAA